MYHRACAERLRDARVLAEMTIAELATTAGVPVDDLTDWELGVYGIFPTPAHMFALAAALERPVDDLFGFDGLDLDDEPRAWDTPSVEPVGGPRLSVSG